MPFASTSATHSFRSRSIPFLTASALSISLYAIHVYSSPLLSDEIQPNRLTTPIKKQRLRPAAASSPYTPLGWGSNRYLTLVWDPSVSTVKRPAPLSRLGSTPLRDLVLMEKYGACVDARGDCWMWGAGYDQSGQVGRSLKGKVRSEPCSQVDVSADLHRKYHLLHRHLVNSSGLAETASFTSSLHPKHFRIVGEITKNEAGGPGCLARMQESISSSSKPKED